MQDLMIQMDQTLKNLRGSIGGRLKVAKERSQAEYEYRSALGTEMAYAKAEGMAATALYDYCRGLEKIASLRCKRDTLRAQEDYLTELIFYYRSQLRIIEGQMKAERQGL